jgi:hypothetical protein
VAFSCILILYGGLDAWPINTEIPRMTFKDPMIFGHNVEESWTFQKIYGVEKVKLQSTYTKVVSFRLKESTFRFVIFWKIFNYILILYGELDVWHSENDV